MPVAQAQRAAEIEIMDAGGYGEGEIRDNLADLRFFNAWFGGSKLMVRAVSRLLARAGSPKRVSLLDVATGSGDIPAALARACASRGVDVLAEGIDSNPDIIAEARRFRLDARGAASPDSHAVRLVRADACRLPHPDRSVDLVVCSNFLHHLESATAVRALEEMKRVARLAVAVVDLTRGSLPLAGVWMLTRLTTMNRITRNDGPLSIRRAFTPEEMRLMAEEAGLSGARVRRAGPVRMELTWMRP